MTGAATRRRAAALGSMALALLVGWPADGQQTVRAPAADLQPLLEATPAGSLLQLEAGRYTGGVIDRPLTLRGRGAATIIDGGGRGSVLRVLAASVTIADVTVRGSGSDLSAKDTGIWIDRGADDARIDGVRLEVEGFGVWVDRAARARVEGCRVVGREDLARVSDRGNGVHLFQATAAVVRGNDITGGRDGVYISNSRGCRIEDNRMRRTRFGVHYMYSHANAVVGNRVDSASVGIALMYSKGILARGNRVRHGHTHGLLLRNLYGSRIEGNDARSSRDGLFFSGCSYDTLAANLSAGNDIGIQVSDAPDNVVTGNAFVGNGQQLVYEGNRTLEWGVQVVDGPAVGNYWSDYSGWDRDGDGVGDKQHFPADIAAYLVGRYPAVRLLLQSPAMVLLQALESRFPVLRPPGIWDRRPLMTNPLTEDPSR